MTDTTSPTATKPDETDEPALDPLPALVADYLACWTTDPADSRTIIERTWADGARLIDPMVDATGHQEIAAVFAMFQSTYPGCTFRQRGGIDAHHTLARWGWEMVDPDGNKVLDGIDVALVDDAGRLSYVAGFFGFELPEG